MYSNEFQTCDWPRNVDCVAGKSNERRNLSTTHAQKEILPSPQSPDVRSTIEEFPQQRLSRSYAGAQPDFKSYTERIPVGRRVKRQMYYGYGYGMDMRTSQAQPQVYDDDDYYYDYSENVSPITFTTSSPLPTSDYRPK